MLTELLPGNGLVKSVNTIFGEASYKEATHPTQQKDQGAKLITEGRNETTWTKNS
jgi:hypothetical protein